MEFLELRNRQVIRMMRTPPASLINVDEGVADNPINPSEGQHQVDNLSSNQSTLDELMDLGPIAGSNNDAIPTGDPSQARFGSNPSQASVKSNPSHASVGLTASQVRFGESSRQMYSVPTQNQLANISPTNSIPSYTVPTTMETQTPMVTTMRTSSRNDEPLRPPRSEYNSSNHSGRPVVTLPGPSSTPPSQFGDARDLYRASIHRLYQRVTAEPFLTVSIGHVQACENMLNQAWQSFMDANAYAYNQGQDAGATALPDVCFDVELEIMDKLKPLFRIG